MQNDAIKETVIDHTQCCYDSACTKPTRRIRDPYTYELYLEEVEIDICDYHLQMLYADI
jgi:hypothetical protein